jgi:hypothetical protein
MTVINLLASTQGLKGNDANIFLAKEIFMSNNKAAAKELVDNLKIKIRISKAIA